MKNTAVMTDTPVGRQLKKDLLTLAVNVGHILIESRRGFYRPFELVPFTDITHYFDADMVELGMIAFKDSPCETILIHDPPRMWAPAFLAKSEIRQNLWHKRFDNPAMC